jgi:hypothetical protein
MQKEGGPKLGNSVRMLKNVRRASLCLTERVDGPLEDPGPLEALATIKG